MCRSNKKQQKVKTKAFRQFMLIATLVASGYYAFRWTFEVTRSYYLKNPFNTFQGP